MMASHNSVMKIPAWIRHTFIASWAILCYDLFLILLPPFSEWSFSITYTHILILQHNPSYRNKKPKKRSIHLNTMFCTVRVTGLGILKKKWFLMQFQGC